MPWAFAALLVACSNRAVNEALPCQAPATKKMAALLDRLARDSDPLKNPFMNLERARAIGAALETTLDPREYLSAQPKYAVELLNAGKTEEAIRELEKLRAFIAEDPQQIELRRQVAHNLAIAYLRLGEQENCILNHSTDSCLLPIRGSGVHKLERGSRAAIEVLMGILKEAPDDLEAAWFLNIAHMTLGEYPDRVPAHFLIPPRAFQSEHEVKRFVDVAPRLGLDVDDLAGGGIVEDFDNDDDLDIMVSSSSLHGQLRYFRNNADGTFTERTEEAGLTGEVGGLNIVHADYDNDGYADVLVLRGGWMYEGGHFPRSLLRNRGDGSFEDTTEAAGLLAFYPTQTAAWFDYDNDGWLDLYIGNETYDQEPHPCQLYHSNRDGTFTECAAAAGVAVLGMVKAVAAGDFNNDGRIDLYLSRRGATNVLFRNDGPGRSQTAGPCGWTFTDVSRSAGVTEPIDSFPTWFWDYDNDGWLDIFVSGYRIGSPADVAADYLKLPHGAERPRLYHNRHDGTFADVTRDAHLDRILHSMGSNYGDLDNDGWLDFYVGTGDPNLRSLFPNRLFRNAEGRLFQDVTTSAGVGHLQKGHGVSFADIDQDGDQDIHQVMGGAFQGDHYRNVLYENPGHGNHWIKLKLVGVKTNRAAIGARIKVLVDTDGGERAIYKTVGSGGSFGGNPLRQEIGLGQARSIRAIEIAWQASGEVQTVRDVSLDQAYLVREGEPRPEPIRLKPFRFADAPARTESPHAHR